MVSPSIQASFRPKALVLPLTKDASTNQYVTQIKQRTPLVPVKLTLDLGAGSLWVVCDQGYVSSTYKSIHWKLLVLDYFPNTVLTGIQNERSMTPLGAPKQMENFLGNLKTVENWEGSEIFVLSRPVTPVTPIAKPCNRAVEPQAKTNLDSETTFPKLFPSVDRTATTSRATSPKLAKPITLLGGKTLQAFLWQPEGTKISNVAPYTVLQTSIYKAVVRAFIKEIPGIPRVPAVAPFGACFNSKGIGFSRVGPGMPIIDLNLPSNVI
ncbi:uncharacterized protein LOC120212389 [Hibiscus syriacus]|uniref:uncharacterized protein LOC120212389 n=1 Tax=Hibiscus syriacus TaxID=106335 RepID=UPI001923727C|nr:uncharacterized protein LOC120212389 [Hibiscus syriacus]